MNPSKSKSDETLKEETDTKIDNNQFPIVGIGASAGGLEALESFFMNMPIDNGMAFVVIQHLPPNYASILPELLQRITPMKVLQASDNLKVKPNCVYVIPPNKSLSILNNSLHLFNRVESSGLHLPINIFFHSLATERMEKSIGIILSGMGTDGSLGLKAIKEMNGLVLVQTPATAQFDGMPRTATAAVIADIIAPVDELPTKLIALLKFNTAVNSSTEMNDKSNIMLDEITTLVRERTGHDFSQYKKNPVYHRIERRMGVHQIKKLSDYVHFCQENPKEVKILFNELLICVTNFFRDNDLWKKLKEKVLPDLIKELPSGNVLRAWVTGCSTGEEAYSLAIVLKEVLEIDENRKNITVQIFATDLNQDAIEKARKGVYSHNIVAEISHERLSRFFTVETEGYRVIPLIREMVVFAIQNVIKDPPFTRLDILTCRNMLIYMEPILHKKLITLFNYSLNPGGIMVLGTSENFNYQNEGFKDIDNKLRIFERTSAPRASGLNEFPTLFNPNKMKTSEYSTSPKAVENIQTLTDWLLLQRFAPASALINDKGDIIYMTGHIGEYLKLVAGKTNWNIYAMAREGFRNELSDALHKARQNYNQVILRNIKIVNNDGSLFVDFIIQRIESKDSLNGMIILLFIDVTPTFEPILSLKTRKNSTGRIKEMEIQMQQSFEDLQEMRIQMQTSQEELKSTNQQLYSANVEIQFINEELSTSKEEMQSLNEELHTVNNELQNKVSDFVRAKNDMKNLLNNTEIAMLFLDKNLNIRRFTDQATKIYKLRKSDIDRPFTDLVSDLQYPEIASDARHVLVTLRFVENAISTYDGRWFNVRIMPYHTMDDRIDGLVITFTDITMAKKAEQALAISEMRYRRLFESAKDGILILDAETGKIMDVNPFLSNG